MLTLVSAREAFHVLLLEYLIARLHPELPSAFALKGGEPTDRAAFEGPGRWDELCLTAGSLIERLLAIPDPDGDAADV